MKKMRNSGFTLIELIVVLTVIAILSTVGLASFSDYNHSQILNAAMLDIYTMLNTAKSRAQSQVKPEIIPESCPSPLEGYKVSICGASACTLGSGDDDYQLQVVCNGGDIRIDGKKLPSNIIHFDSSTVGKIFFFPVIKGGTIISQNTKDNIITDGTITINGYGKTRTITVTESGGISASL